MTALLDAAHYVGDAPQRARAGSDDSDYAACLALRKHRRCDKCQAREHTLPPVTCQALGKCLAREHDRESP